MFDVNQLTPQQLTDVTFICKVVNVDDPLKLGRIQARIPLLYDKVKDSQLPWARPENFNSGSQVPVKNTHVYVRLDKGDRSMPIYSGQVITKEFIATSPFSKGTGKVRGIFDGKSFIILNSETGDIEINSKSNLIINSGGNANITINGNTNIKSDGNVSVEAGGNVSVDAGGNANVEAAGMVNITGTMINLNM